jgi:hypothetical protein
MPEHLIRLRGGWHRLDPTDDSDAWVPLTQAGRRVTLPWTWPGEPAGTVRLARSFGPPPFDPESEALSLRFAGVEGLRSARLNGREIVRGTSGKTAHEIPLSDSLPRRNLLVLDVDPPGIGQVREDWGAIALVIGPRERVYDVHPGQLLGGCVPGQ